MTTLPLLLLLAGHPAAARTPTRAAPPAAPAPTVHRWADGLTLVVQPVPGATTSSLRLVVRAGGAFDPLAKAGLAHLVEHVLVQQGDAGRNLMREVRGAGGTLNAHTSHTWTMFELDAPAARFPALAERYVRLVTGPAWDDVDLRAEREVVDRESDLRGSEEVSMVDEALFPAPAQAGPLIGSRESRHELTIDDAQQFFREHYLPGWTTLVMTGAISPDDAVALVERAYLIPPLPVPAAPAPDRLNVPLEQNAPSLITATAQGYALDPRDREVCEDLAALLELRLVLAIREGGPHVSQAATTCARMRGHDLLLAFAYTSTLDAPELPAQIDAVFRGIARVPPSADEWARLERRRAHRRERIEADPVDLANALSLFVGDVGPEKVAEALTAPAHPPRRLQEAAARSLVPERRFQLNFGLHE